MKTKYVLIGFLLGITCSIFMAILLTSQPVMANRFSQSPVEFQVTKWPDSLDAVKADPQNHKIVFENKKVRILEVFGGPHAAEPIHTHQWPSIMWSADSNFTKARLIYYHYGYDSVKKNYFLKDSLIERGPPPNIGFEVGAEGPHRVTNLSDVPIKAYRVEFKN
jgi:hypothetical protein